MARVNYKLAMLPAIAAVSTFASTLIGGLVALRFAGRYLRQIMGFTAGVLLAVVAFDILPELFELVQSTGIKPVLPMAALVAGFLVFHLTERLLAPHHAHEGGHVHGRQ